MVGLKIECTGMLIENFASQDKSVELIIILKNSGGRISLISIPSKPRSKHEFTIHTATNVGYSGKYNLTREQSTKIFLLACTLLDPRKYFSLIQPDCLSSILVPDIQPPSDTNTICEITSYSTGIDLTIPPFSGRCDSLKVLTHLTSQFEIDVNSLFSIIDNLLRYRIFDTQNRTNSELNVIDAIKSYRDSLSAIDPRSCYLSMYAAFEKLVNANMERFGPDFDMYATSLNGMNQADITHLRELENRLKHRLRNVNSDLAILKKFEENPGSELGKIKTATDLTLLFTIR